MELEYIKSKLKEAINEFIDVNEAKDKKKDDDKGEKDTDKNVGGGKKDYTDVRRAFEKLGGPSMVDIMVLTGTKDDKKGVNRSLFRKKVKQVKNKDTGSYYQFDDEELNQVRAAIGIKK
jgi:hypothetical protein